MNNKYEKILLELCMKASNKNEIPVGAIIVCNNKVIAKAYNRKNIDCNSLYHAEILCLQKAYKKLKRWNLSDCEMYVSLEPCDMCKLLIQESRIKRAFYILIKGKCNNKYNKTQYEQVFGDNGAKFKEIMNDFFEKLRK